VVKAGGRACARKAEFSSEVPTNRQERSASSMLPPACGSDLPILRRVAQRSAVTNQREVVQKAAYPDR